MDSLEPPDQPPRPSNGTGSRRRTGRRFGRTAVLVSAGSALVAVAGVGVVVYANHGEETTAPSDCRISKTRSVGLHGIRDVSPSGEYFLGSVEGDDRVVRKGHEPVRLWPVVAEEFGFAAGERGAQSTTTAVNSDGAVVGEAQWPASADSNRLTTAHWVYRDGEVTELTAPAEYTGEEWSLTINGFGEDGTVAGQVTKVGEPLTLPLKWGPDTYEPVELDPDGSDAVLAAAVTADGTVIGVEAGRPTEDPLESRPKRILSWNPDGELADLPFDDKALRDPSSWIPEVSGDWILVGDHRWKLGGEDPPRKVLPSAEYPGGEDVTPYLSGPDRSIDARGRVYGVDGGKPVVEIDGELHRLPVKADKENGNGAEYYATRPGEVSDDGSVVLGTNDYYDYDNSSSEPFVWLCGD